MDRLSGQHRSWNMSRIRARDTGPEKTVRSLLFRMGFRFRLYRRDLPGTPDIVLPRLGTVIFVHGCFWHRHPKCRFASTPKTRVEFWEHKFQLNVRRDRVARARLWKNGWRVVTVWECEVRDPARLERRLRRELAPAPSPVL